MSSMPHLLLVDDDEEILSLMTTFFRKHGHTVSVAGGGDGQPLALAVEQLQAEFGLQSLHLMADGTLGDAQFVRGSGEALVSRRGLK